MLLNEKKYLKKIAIEAKKLGYELVSINGYNQLQFYGPSGARFWDGTDIQSWYPVNSKELPEKIYEVSYKNLLPWLKNPYDYWWACKIWSIDQFLKLPVLRTPLEVKGRKLFKK